MKQLHQKIESQKHNINQKKEFISKDFEAAKRRLTAPTGLSLTTIGGLAVGFLLLPKKFKIIKAVLKAYGMAATVKSFFNLLPEDRPSRAKSTRRHHNDDESF